METPEEVLPLTALAIFAIFYIAIIGLFILIHWKVYTKANRPGWHSLIPIYSLIVLLEMIGKPTWWWLMFFIPFVNFYYFYQICAGLSKSFGKDSGFAIGLLLLNPIFMGILAFGDAQYLGPNGAEDDFSQIGSN